MSKMPDIIYAEIIEIYGDRSPVRTWHDYYRKSGIDKYYSQEHVNQLLDQNESTCGCGGKAL